MKAYLVGASGLVGHHLTRHLLQLENCELVIAINRRSLPEFKSNPKYKELIFDFKNWEDLEAALKATQPKPQDLGLSTLGSTIKKAGTQKKFYEVDHDFVVQFAKLCKKLGINNFSTITAMGADPHSRIFYNRVKGETERDLEKISFQKLLIARPSLLLGERQEKRIGEKLAIKLSPLLQRLLAGPLKKYQPIEAEQVAKAIMGISIANKKTTRIVENRELRAYM